MVPRKTSGAGNLVIRQSTKGEVFREQPDFRSLNWTYDLPNIPEPHLSRK